MSDRTKKVLNTLKQGLYSLKTLKEDKRAYKEYLERIKALPDDYQFTFQKISEYMWENSGGGNGYDMLALQRDLLELFENGAVEGKGVLSVTGEDVAAFCDELLRSAKTYTENRHKKLNRDIAKKLGNTVQE